jgi:hypothetical protein
MKRSHAGKAAAIGAAALCGLIVAGVAMARPPAKATPETAKQTREERLAEWRANLKTPDSVFALSNAMRAFIDPLTGQLREPTAEDLAALNRAAGRIRSSSEAAVEVFELSGGGIGAAVPEELASSMTAHIEADGSLELSCHQGSPDGDAAAAAPAATGSATDNWEEK